MNIGALVGPNGSSDRADSPLSSELEIPHHTRQSDDMDIDIDPDGDGDGDGEDIDADADADAEGELEEDNYDEQRLGERESSDEDTVDDPGYDPKPRRKQPAPKPKRKKAKSKSKSSAHVETRVHDDP
jgi:hypothetical protein